MPGDFIVPLIDRAWGIDSLSLFLSLMRGETLAAIPPEARGGAAIRYFEAASGTVVNITGVEEARLLDGVLDVELDVEPGDRVSEVSSSWDRAGFVIAEAATPRAATYVAAEAAARVRVEVAADDAALEAA